MIKKNNIIIMALITSISLAASGITAMAKNEANHKRFIDSNSFTERIIEPRITGWGYTNSRSNLRSAAGVYNSIVCTIDEGTYLFSNLDDYDKYGNYWVRVRVMDGPYKDTVGWIVSYLVDWE